MSTATSIPHIHLLFDLLAYSVGFQYFLWLRTREPQSLPHQHQFTLLGAALFGAIVGGHALGLAEHPELWATAFHSWKAVFAAKTIVGGILGGIIGVEITKKLLRIHTSTGDAFCYPLILGIMIGRIGCFLSGIHDGTHGLPTNSILGIDMGDGTPRHPVALYEIAYLACVGLFIDAIHRRHTLVQGGRFMMFMTYYLGWRLFIDFYKPITPIPHLGLSAIQCACALGLAYYYRVWLRPRSLMTR